MIEWPDDIVIPLARRRATLVLGAGVSRNSQDGGGGRPPLWSEFLQRGIEKCGGPHREMRRLLKQGDLLGCCQMVKYRLGPDWIPFVESQFLHPDYKSHEIHEYIFNLDSSIVLTPNVDRIYDNFAVARAGNRVKIKKYYEDDLGRAIRGTGQQRLILKIHGCIDAADKLVFTREDYADIRAKHAAFYRAVEALFLTTAVVFLGCGLSDPDLSLLLEQYARSFEGSPPHYFITSSNYSEDYAGMVLKNYNMTLIKYSPRDNHAELANSIRVLVDLVDAKRVELAQTALW